MDVVFNLTTNHQAQRRKKKTVPTENSFAWSSQCRANIGENIKEKQTLISKCPEELRLVAGYLEEP